MLHDVCEINSETKEGMQASHTAPQTHSSNNAGESEVWTGQNGADEGDSTTNQTYRMGVNDGSRQEKTNSEKIRNGIDQRDLNEAMQQ